MTSAETPLATNSVPLAVDLDGTLIKTDILWESFFALLKQDIFSIFLVPFWLMKGKAYLKREIARRTTLDITSLPYNDEFLRFLQEEHERGRTLILTTASDGTVARKIADHLGIFSEVIASNGRQNMKGLDKSRALQDRFGNKGFDYAGNENVDLKVWAHANAAIIVDAPDAVVKQTERIVRVNQVFSRKKDLLKALVRVIRAKHWVKNILIFVPLLTAHQLTNFALLLQATFAFVAFSLVASSVYLFNDLADLNNDRQHHEKKNRPFASGELPLLAGLVMIPLFLLGAIFVSLLLPPGFLFVLAAYCVLNIAYSLYLKQVLLVDVLLLATFYTLRVLAGGVATGFFPSQWLLEFSVFIFLSLAFAKRVSELQFLRENHKEKAKGRGYVSTDLEQLAVLGAASGYLAVLVFSLYINSPEVRQLYTYPQALWIVCPFLLYWISRLWLLVHRRQIPEDPVVFVLKDKVSCLVGLAVAIALIVAT